MCQALSLGVNSKARPECEMQGSQPSQKPRGCPSRPPIKGVSIDEGQLLCFEGYAWIFSEATIPTGCFQSLPGSDRDSKTGPSREDPGPPWVIKIGSRTLQCPYPTSLRLLSGLHSFDPHPYLPSLLLRVRFLTQSDGPLTFPFSLTGFFCNKTLPYLILSSPAFQRTSANIFSI